MPLYEYSCQQCGKRFEVLQKFSDAPIQVHEGCGGAVDRLISPPSFRFKGSGFYITDYAGNGKGNNGGAKAKQEAAERKAENTPSSKKESSTPAPVAPAAQPSSTPTQGNA